MELNTEESDYLAKRQIAHEINSPAARALSEFAAEGEKLPKAPTGEEGPPPRTEVPQFEMEAEAAATARKARQAEMESGAVSDPILDPTMAFFAGGAGGVASSILRKGGAKLFPTLAKFLVAGGITAGAEYPIGAAAEAISGGEEKVGIPAAIALSFLSGATIEATAIRAIEKQIAKAGTKKTVDTAKVAAKALDSYKAGREDEFTEAISIEMRDVVDDEAVKAVSARQKDAMVSVTDEDAAKFLAEYVSDITQKYGGSGGNINFERISSSEDIKKVYEKTQMVFSANIDEARRGKISNEDTQRLADDLGMTTEQLLSRRSGQAFNAEEAVAARHMLVSSAQKLNELATKVSSRTATDIDKFNFQKQLTLHEAIQEQVAGMTAEAGRALQSFNIPVGAKAPIVEDLEQLAQVAVSLSQKASDTGVSDFIGIVTRIKKEVC